MHHHCTALRLFCRNACLTRNSLSVTLAYLPQPYRRPSLAHLFPAAVIVNLLVGLSHDPSAGGIILLARWFSSGPSPALLLASWLLTPSSSHPSSSLISSSARLVLRFAGVTADTMDLIAARYPSTLCLECRPFLRLNCLATTWAPRPSASCCSSSWSAHTGTFVQIRAKNNEQSSRLRRPSSG